MDIKFTGPESTKLRVEEEEKLTTYLSKATKEVMHLDQELVDQAVLGYKQAANEVERKYYCNELLMTIQNVLTKHSKMLVPHTAEMYMTIMIRGIKSEDVRVGESIVIRCRCKSTDGLLDLEKLVASGELDELFSLIMSYLINQQVTASVRISREEFEKCLVSLTADAG